MICELQLAGSIRGETIDLFPWQRHDLPNLLINDPCRFSKILETWSVASSSHDITNSK